MKNCDIFYKSYAKDFRLLKYSLRSLAMHITGYNNIIILIPEKDKHLLDISDLPKRTKIFIVGEYGSGYLYQQVCKIQAHKYSDANFIMFSDSDCIFDHPVNLQDLIKTEKPEILYTDYSKVGDAICWKKPTEDFIKEPVNWEFMRRNCMIYNRETLVQIEKYEPNLEHIIMTSNLFSEYNAMGAFAFKYHFNNYTFINTDSIGIDPSIQNVMPLAIQLWSYADKNDKSEYHQTEYKKIQEAIKRVFNEEYN